MLWTVWTTTPKDRYPAQMTREGAQVPLKLSETAIGRDGKPTDFRARVSLHRAYTFEAENIDDANRIYNGLLLNGIPKDGLGLVPVQPNPKRVWRHRGAPHYLGIEGRRMALSDMYIKRAGTDSEVWKLNKTISALNESYHGLRSRRAGQLEGFPESEKAAAAQSIRHAEQSVQMFVCMAAAAQSMVDEANAAYGLDPVERDYQAVCTADLKDAVEAKQAEIDSFRTVVLDLQAQLATSQVSTTELADAKASVETLTMQLAAHRAPPPEQPKPAPQNTQPPKPKQNPPQHAGVKP